MNIDQALSDVLEYLISWDIERPIDIAPKQYATVHTVHHRSLTLSDWSCSCDIWFCCSLHMARFWTHLRRSWTYWSVKAIWWVGDGRTSTRQCCLSPLAQEMPLKAARIEDCEKVKQLFGISLCMLSHNNHYCSNKNQFGRRLYQLTHYWTSFYELNALHKQSIVQGTGLNSI